MVQAKDGIEEAGMDPERQREIQIVHYTEMQAKGSIGAEQNERTGISESFRRGGKPWT
jgi:hypothetical protein